jgi:NAD(P) transhydrogenase
VLSPHPHPLVPRVLRTHTAAALLGGWAVGRYLGLDEVTSATYLVSSAMCIAAIACLSQQSSARTGNALGLIGVSGGIVATLGGLNTDPGTYTQVCWLARVLECTAPQCCKAFCTQPT